MNTMNLHNNIRRSDIVRCFGMFFVCGFGWCLGSSFIGIF